MILSLILLSAESAALRVEGTEVEAVLRAVVHGLNGGVAAVGLIVNTSGSSGVHWEHLEIHQVQPDDAPPTAATAPPSSVVDTANSSGTGDSASATAATTNADAAPATATASNGLAAGGHCGRQRATRGPRRRRAGAGAAVASAVVIE